MAAINLSEVRIALKEFKQLIDNLPKSGSFLKGESKPGGLRSQCYKNFTDYPMTDTDSCTYGCFSKRWDRVFQGKTGQDTVNEETGKMTTTYCEED